MCGSKNYWLMEEADTLWHSLKEIFMQHNIDDTVAKGNGQIARYSSMEEGYSACSWMLFGVTIQNFSLDHTWKHELSVSGFWCGSKMHLE
jgi:hypothetical protein